MHTEFVRETELQKETEHVLTQQHELLPRLAQTTTNERQAFITAYLQEQIAKAIGISTCELDVQQPLNHMGIDSLLAVELRNRLRTDLKVDIVAVKFMEDTSIASLAMQISELLTTNAPSGLFASLQKAHTLNQDSQKVDPAENREHFNQTAISEGDWLEGEI
ncbi:phosphopantetheine-containing protein [Cylindrospermum stagnale PCC 7417]|uniref:Phosphopantetheine-containing protein n=1 Tax=Cylindrospermum stagnale PCC 7417 TaxID=56107 RepID=K9X321_9NOST|nr:acyl carrier protein [Cylindrospermum stagnale]AFZ26072.1 phosphopantetheine-containing protein [Cylindrospermum stagnale PCC 7417]